MAPTTERMTREERREVIIEAAMAEFAVGGLHGTPVDAIARRVGVSQPYLFQLFGTKVDLFIEALRRGHREILRAFMEAAAAVPADAGSDQVFHAMGHAYRDLVDDRILLLMQMQGYAACDDPAVKEVVRDEFAKIYRFVARSSGAPAEEIRGFFAEGMLMNVAAAMDLAALQEDWARVCVGDPA